MSILYLMIPMGILIVIGALWAFFWAVSNDQFDDLESPAWRILLDDDRKPPAANRPAGRRNDTDDKEDE
ncbi:MAG: cbb3-type cytochrome oxidase assembly protein CcoS [Gammaproteobacteria bacterium]